MLLIFDLYFFLLLFEKKKKKKESRNTVKKIIKEQIEEIATWPLLFLIGSIFFLQSVN